MASCRDLTVLQGQFLQDARTTLSRAQSQTQDAFQRYTACLEAESRARREVVLAEQHRDELSKCHETRARELLFTKWFNQCLHYSHEHRQPSVRKMGIQTPTLLGSHNITTRICTSSIFASRRCSEFPTYTACATHSARRKIRY